MRETIEELFRMYKVEPVDALIDALVLYVEHECLNAKHELVVQTMHKIDEVTGKK